MLTLLIKHMPYFVFHKKKLKRFVDSSKLKFNYVFLELKIDKIVIIVVIRDEI